MFSNHLSIVAKKTILPHIIGRMLLKTAEHASLRLNRMLLETAYTCQSESEYICYSKKRSKLADHKVILLLGML